MENTFYVRDIWWKKMVQINTDYFMPTNRLKNSIKDRDDNIKALTELLSKEKNKVDTLMRALKMAETKYEYLKRIEMEWLEELYKRYNYNEFQKRVAFLREK